MTFALHMSAFDPKRSTNGLRQTKGWAAPVRLSSRKNRSNGGKTVQAQHCSIRYGEYNGLKTGERIDFPKGELLWRYMVSKSAIPVQQNN